VSPVDLTGKSARRPSIVKTFLIKLPLHIDYFISYDLLL